MEALSNMALPLLNHCLTHQIVHLCLPRQSDHIEIFSHYLTGPTQMIY